MSERAELVRQTFVQQASACDKLGSPFMGHLCRLLAERLTANDPVGEKVLNWPGDPSGQADSVPLRLAGALHALVLSGKDVTLKAAYPPNSFDADKVWAAVVSAFENHTSFLLKRLDFAPQTNEVRRSAMILPGFLEIVRLTGKPLVLSEVGSSAGLNLNWDLYCYRYGAFSWGDPAAGVSMAPDYEGPEQLSVSLTVKDRRGCDLNPLDAADPQQQMRMLAYIWPDQPDRLERTRHAFEIASRYTPAIDRADAVDWLRDRLAVPFEGAAHVIFSTIAWQYLPEAAREKGREIIESAGSRASVEAPLAWLRMEADGQQGSAAVTLQLWPDGERRELGRADFHGRWLKWHG